MTYVALSLVGIIAALFVRSKWNLKVQLIFIVSALILSLVISFVIGFFLRNTGFIGKGDSSFWAEIPWLDISLYFSMVIGMAAKHFYDAIHRSRGKTPVFKKWQLVKPLLVSPIIFGVIYGNIDEEASSILLLIFAFQNGFFWQTVLGGNKGGY